MRRITAVLAIAVVFFVVCPAYADYSVSDKGIWPDSWPKELEPLRKQARTLEGPMVLNRHYQIPFTNREQFEAAWPHLLKVKSKGAPIILVRAPKTDFFAIEPAGVLIHTPPVEEDKPGAPAKPIPGQGDPRSKWMRANYFELAVDGKIVDLNRIPLPEDTPIVDERFKKKDNEAAGRSE